MSEKRESFGRIEVAPDVLVTIVRLTALRIEGVRKLAAPPAEMSRFFRRTARQDGVLLDIEDGKLKFDVYVLMDPHVNVLETSRKLQSAIIEAIDKMVGVPVSAVNVHVEDVIYAENETA